ncbi:MAG: hypothetical protein ACOH2T_17810 [Pseudomonas sp.]
MNSDFTDSPFAKHGDLLLQHDYSVVQRLSLCVLSLYNGEEWKCRLDWIASFDAKHLQILMDMLASYNRYGENDPYFMDLGRKLWDRYEPTRRKRRSRRTH